ncbi:hypothetical protein BLNAU_23934 [Blattamonas nauphoetae]|uniref:Uncharacterized protein n=1 Tax=Blattamonas nauphoetae TaxID=2049346 RepID=A0ABQ9WPV3_9EUKA|nr:hypothetical protein BLNAU_23934 [Blattamonas nauphoetae]
MNNHGQVEPEKSTYIPWYLLFDKEDSMPTGILQTVLGNSENCLHIVKWSSLRFYTLDGPSTLGKLQSATFVNEAKTKVELLFDSKKLVSNGKYELELGCYPSSDKNLVFVVQADKDGVLLPFNVTVDPFEIDSGTFKRLLLGMGYSAVTMKYTGKDDYSIRIMDPDFRMPDICRAAEINSTTLNKQKTELTVAIRGELFNSSISSVSPQRGESVIPSTSVDFISPRKIEAVFSVAFDETDDTLSFGEEYTLLSISGEDEVLVREGLVVAAPSPPFVSSITPSPHPSSPTPLCPHCST